MGSVVPMILVLAFMLLQLVCCQDVITTIAGTYGDDYSGDGGDATSAALNYLEGVAVDMSGMIYIITTSVARLNQFYFVFFLFLKFPYSTQATCTSLILIIIVSAR